jgi:hypothetical protein
MTMGLLDMFGAGGGTLTLQLQAMQFAPGQTIYGVATFTGGKRAQNITSITVRVSMTETHPAVPGKPPPPAQTINVVPDQMLTGAFQVQPGTPHPFQFALQLPTQLKPEVKGQIDYRVGASADIPGEIDQHASADIQVIGGMQQPQMQQMQQPMMQKPMMDKPMMDKPMQAPMGKPGMFEMGQGVFAEHPKLGGWHPGRIVALQNGMVGVDWADPKLGESSWLQPHQVQHGK